MAYVNLQEMAVEAFHHIEKKEYSQAEKKISYLLDANPKEAVLYYYMGCLYLGKKQWAFAAMAFEKALDIQPNFDECLNNMATAYRQLGDIASCITCFTKAAEIASHPNYLAKCDNDKAKADRNLADYWGNLGSCYVGRGNPTQAIEYLKKSLEIVPKTPNAMWNIGLAYLELGNYKDGFEGYSYNLLQKEAKTRNYHAPHGTTAVWTGPAESPIKPTVVVYGEQGIGDEIMFASMLKEMTYDADVIMECHPRLLEMFRRSFPDVTIYGTRKAIEISWLKNHKNIDYQIPLSQLGQFYRKKKEDFPGMPYLDVDPKYTKKAADRLATLDTQGHKLKIGISWKGGVGSTNKPTRTIPLTDLLPILKNREYDFISLQYHSNAQAEIDAFNEAQGEVLITHWQDIVDDYDLTAGLLLNLDMVVSVPQSVVHLAGALGVPTIQMCPKQGLWQMGPYGEDAPWYKSVTNRWQLVDGNWDTVVANVAMELEHKGNLNANHGRVSKT